METVSVHGIRIFGYHGCMREEELIGTWFEVDVDVSADLKMASHSDRIADTTNYVAIVDIVKREMHIRANLIEHVGRRILEALKSELGSDTAKVVVKKLNPPVEAEVGYVSVTMQY